MSIKSVGTFSPAMAPHATWIDQNVGNKDGQLDAQELETYKQKFPDASAYAPLKGELGTTTGQAVTNTTNNKPGPVNVGAGGGVLGFLLANKGAVADAGKPAAPVSSTGVKQSLPLDKLTTMGASAAGEVFQLDTDSVNTMSVRARQVVHPTYGAGTEFNLSLTAGESFKLGMAFASNQFPGAEQKQFTLEKAEFKDGATVLTAETPYLPRKGYSGELLAYRLEEPNKYVLEYIPPRENPQAYRDKVRLRVFGATNEERAGNLKAALERIQVPGLMADAAADQADLLKRMSVLRMVDPKKAEELSKGLATLDAASVNAALLAAGVDETRLAGVRMEEVFPGQMAAVDPALGEAYAQAGVRAVMVGIRDVDSAVKVLTSDGLMSSLERYSRGLHKAGASLTSDEASGGAEFAFTRLVTPKAISAATSITSSYGAGVVQLVSAGDQAKELLSRTDWHAYANDSYGTTVARRQTEGPEADPVATSEFNKRTSKFSDRPVLGELVAQVNGDTKLPGGYSTGSYASGNEACFKSGVKASAWTNVLVGSEQVKAQVIQGMEMAGVTSLNGVPLTEAVKVAVNWKEAGDALGLAG